MNRLSQTIGPVTLECDWFKLLPVVNNTDEINRVKKINPNIKLAPYPLTRQFLNNYFLNSEFNIKSQFTFDCAASMYSYFLNTYGYSPGGASNFPIATGAGGASSGLNPAGFINVDLFPPWLLALLLVGVIVFFKARD